MTEAETSKLLRLLRMAWPEAVVTAETIMGWTLILGELPYEAAERAATTWLRTAKWFPRPAELLELAAEAALDLPNVGDAWRMVERRIRETYPGHAAEPWHVPEAVIRATEAMGGVHTLRMSERIGADQHRFGELYAEYRRRAIQEAQRNPAMLAAGQRPALAEHRERGPARHRRREDRPAPLPPRTGTDDSRPWWDQDAEEDQRP